MAGYRDLKVWQSAMLLAEEAHRVVAGFPKNEVYGLTSQVQRSSVSIPSNIAEGQGRNSSNEFRHFLGIALGSLAELETQIILAQRFNYITEQQSGKVLQLAGETGKMLKGLQKSLTND